METIKEKSVTGKTIEAIMGEMVWLMSQSPAHKYITMGDFEWFMMPPILLKQFQIFRDDNQKPVGFALWALLNEEAEQKLQATSKLSPQDWGNNAQVSEAEGLVANEGGQMCLIELLAPFHNDTNHHREQMIADLMQNEFSGETIKAIEVDAVKGVKKVVTMEQSNAY